VRLSQHSAAHGARGGQQVDADAPYIAASPGFLLWRTSVKWRREISRSLVPLGLTQAQYVVLAGTGWLMHAGGPVRRADVGRHIGMDPNTLSKVVSGLEQRRLIALRTSRGSSPRGVRLTQPGRQLLARALAVVEAADLRFFTALRVTDEHAAHIFRQLARGVNGSGQPSSSSARAINGRPVLGDVSGSLSMGVKTITAVLDTT